MGEQRERMVLERKERRGEREKKGGGGRRTKIMKRRRGEKKNSRGKEWGKYMYLIHVSILDKRARKKNKGLKKIPENII